MTIFDPFDLSLRPCSTYVATTGQLRDLTISQISLISLDERGLVPLIGLIFESFMTLLTQSIYSLSQEYDIFL